MATMEDQKPRAAKLGTKSAGKDVKSSTSSPEKSEEQPEAAESGGDGSMKALIDEASRMLKSMNEGEAKEKMQSRRSWACKNSLISSRRLQCDHFAFPSCVPWSTKACWTLGRHIHCAPSEEGSVFNISPRVKVTLAGDKEIYMALTPTGVIVGEE